MDRKKKIVITVLLVLIAIIFSGSILYRRNINMNVKNQIHIFADNVLLCQDELRELLEDLYSSFEIAGTAQCIGYNG